MLIFRSDLHRNYLEMSRVIRTRSQERTRSLADPEGFSVLFRGRYHIPLTSTASLTQSAPLTLLSAVSKSPLSPHWRVRLDNLQGGAVKLKRPAQSTVLLSSRNPVSFPIAQPWQRQAPDCPGFSNTGEAWKEQDSVWDCGPVLYSAICC